MLKSLRFIFISVFAGIVAAAIILSLGRDDSSQLTLVTHTDVSPEPVVLGPFSYAEAVDRASTSVVNIYATKIRQQRISPLFDDPFFRNFFGDAFRGLGEQSRTRKENSLGSGVIVDPRGYIVTNNHVVADADEIKVVLSDGTDLDAEVVGTDPESDVAVLRVENGQLPAITLGLSERLRVGDVVLAIGNPFGVGQTVTMGIVSATGRNQLGITSFENFIQTDAAINPGNSGGALIDARGNLVGINTAIFSKSGGSQGVGFAIPVDMVRGIMEQLVEHGEVSRGWLGMAGQDVTRALAESFGLENVDGVLISTVYRDGPAHKAGILPGDVVTTINGKRIKAAADIVNLVAALPPGEEVSVTGWREGESFERVVRLGRRPATSGR